MRRLVLLGVATAAALVPLASSEAADSCSRGLVGTGSHKLGEYWVDDRDSVAGNGLWIYQETNGNADSLTTVAGTKGAVYNDQYKVGSIESCSNGGPGGTDRLIF